jgi:hypothetical protein
MSSSRIISRDEAATSSGPRATASTDRTVAFACPVRIASCSGVSDQEITCGLPLVARNRRYYCRRTDALRCPIDRPETAPSAVGMRGLRGVMMDSLCGVAWTMLSLMCRMWHGNQSSPTPTPTPTRRDAMAGPTRTNP